VLWDQDQHWLSDDAKAFRDEAERNHILKVLQKNGGNVSQTAVELGIRRTYLHRRMSQLGIDKKAIYGS
jgi:transcriptional regulator of acetoin/glycerol metabolism